MAEFPALPLFTDAYLADTRHLSVEEHGAYLLLLICAWRTRGCFLRDDDRQLARLVGVTPRRWQRLRPVLADLFQVGEGFWRQKKLTSIYETVARKVENNRMNGARGGRARAARLAACPSQNPKEGERANASTRGGPADSNPLANGLATKTRTKTKTKKAEACSNALPSTGSFAAHQSAIAAAAGLSDMGLDEDTLACWQAAGVDAPFDIVPVITRLRLREEQKGRTVPRSLAYYRAAVLEARDQRLGAVTAGEQHAANHPARPTLRAFDTASAADWQQFLGDKNSKFRGDYISQNWLIPTGHPVFLPADLGPDPRHRFNGRIPADIQAAYGPRWGWLQKSEY